MEAALRAKDLVRQILTFSRHNNEQFTSLNIKSIAEEAVQFLRASIPSTIAIELEVTDEVGPVLADPTQILQVLMNLCTNAAQAMERDGGQLTITLSKAESCISLRELLPGVSAQSVVHLSVSDTGPGIPYHIRDKIFEPFFTTKEIDRGSGLGLSVVYSIIDGCGGAVTVESESGQGSTFNVFLPETLSEVLARRSNLKGPMKGSERILLVDDEKMISDMGAQILSRQGFNVTTENSSKNAFRLFSDNPDAFDLLITDQTMPGMTGVQLAEKILSVRPDFPIILCTGFSTTVDEEKVRQLGIRAFIMKPFLKRELVGSIRAVLDKGKTNGQ